MISRPDGNKRNKSSINFETVTASTDLKTTDSLHGKACTTNKNVSSGVADALSGKPPRTETVRIKLKRNQSSGVSEVLSGRLPKDETSLKVGKKVSPHRAMQS
jgi:hypothetical protein